MWPIIVLTLSLLNWIPYLYSRSIQESTVTTDNVESKVRGWLDAFELGTTKQSSPEAFFVISVALKNGVKIAIARTKEHEHYLTLQANVIVDSPLKTRYQELSQDERRRLLNEIRQELARARIGYTIERPLDLSNVVLMRLVPITDDLTESLLIERLDEVDAAVTLFVTTLDLRLMNVHREIKQ